MNTDVLITSLPVIFGELTRGASPKGGFVLNAGDPGLLGALDHLSAADASVSRHGGATVAAHVDHLRYGLSLMNRWAGGEPDPFSTADWSAAWTRTTVTDDEWHAVREALRDEIDRWQVALQQPRDARSIEVHGMIGSVAHLAYHLGAIRQIVPAARGPREPHR